MRKLFWLLLVGSCFGQVINDTALQNSAGNYARVVPFAPVTVCAANDTNVPCTSITTTYTTSSLSVACTAVSGGNGGPTSGTGCNNPGIADANGNFTVFVPGGQYTVCVYSVTWICVQKNGGFGVSSGPSTSAEIGDILRWNFNGDGLWGPAGYPQTFDGVVATSVNVGTAMGLYAATAPVGCCSESITGNVPTAANPFLSTTYSSSTQSTSGVIGLQHAENGNSGVFFVRGFWKMTHRLAITASANTRYWWGLAVWANASSLGNNGTNILGTTALATDTPNKTLIGWRWSSTTDANFEFCVIQAGASPGGGCSNSGVAVDNNFHRYDVTLDQANTTYTFYIDGKSVGTVAASTITFTPVNSLDAQATVFFTGDNKNTATGVFVNFANMFISLRQ